MEHENTKTNMTNIKKGVDIKAGLFNSELCYIAINNYVEYANMCIVHYLGTPKFHD